MTDAATLTEAEDRTAPPHAPSQPRFSVAPAVRRQQLGRIAIGGPSGSGLTMTSLEIASALGGPIALVDTKRGHASLYADRYEFQTLQVSRFSPESLVDILAHCANWGMPTVIVDTVSAWWSGQSGVLDQVDSASGRGTSGWTKVRPRERRMLDALLAYPGHVIVTVRVKTDVVAEADDSGRHHPRVVGLKWEQRDGFEYEWGLTATMDLTQTLVVTSAADPDLIGLVEQHPGADFAERVRTWLETGDPVDPPIDAFVRWAQQQAVDATASFDQLRAVVQAVRDRNAEGTPFLRPDGKAALLGEVLDERGQQFQLEQRRNARNRS